MVTFCSSDSASYKCGWDRTSEADEGGDLTQPAVGSQAQDSGLKITPTPTQAVG